MALIDVIAFIIGLLGMAFWFMVGGSFLIATLLTPVLNWWYGDGSDEQDGG